MFNVKKPADFAVTIIMLTVALQIAVQTLPTLITAFINLSNVSNLSFSSFFAANGVALLMLSVAILIGIFAALGLKKGRGGF